MGKSNKIEPEGKKIQSIYGKTNFLNQPMNKRTLDEQRIEFSNQKFLATPLAGLVVWTVIGFAGIFFSDFIAVWSIFISSPS